MSAIPVTKASSIQERIHNVRFMKEINPFYLRALNKDLDDLDNVEPDISFALRGLLLAYQGDLESLKYWNKAIALNPSAEHYYNFGVCCNVLGDHIQALSIFRSALELSKTNTDILHLLRSTFSNFYAYDESKIVVETLNKLEKKSYPFYEDKIFAKFFGSNSQLMLEFGLGTLSVISKHISFKWILHKEDGLIEDRHYSINIVKCLNNDDVERVAECNAELSEFIVDFEEKHELNLENLYITCEATE